jgi:drug/metabolite transporter (DMT)-like permease
MIFVAPAWLWAVFTVTAAAAQTARNAMQRDLIAKIGMAGATHVRFIFALPFAVLFLIAQWLVIGIDLPAPSVKTCLWACVGAAAQTVATALMLAAMRDRSFVVSIAFTKIEPIVIAIFGIIFLHDTPSPGVAVAILVATAGVMLMSWPRTTPDVEKSLRDWTPALMGISAGACFALSGTGYRGAILSLDTPSFVLAATTTLALGLAIQTCAIVAWLAVADGKTLVSILAHWRPSLFAGFMGALASQFWFLGFAITTAAKVRTLALVEVLFAQVVSGRIKQQTSMREYAGMAMIVAGIVLLLNF